MVVVPSTGVEPTEARRRVPEAQGVAACAVCTDASGNYVAVDPDVSLDDYIDVESLSGHLLCPGACWRRPAGSMADPSRAARLVYFGTSDENLLLESAGAAPTVDMPVAASDPDPGEPAFFGRDVVAFLRRLRTPADAF